MFAERCSKLATSVSVASGLSFVMNNNLLELALALFDCARIIEPVVRESALVTLKTCPDVFSGSMKAIAPSVVAPLLILIAGVLSGSVMSIPPALRDKSPPKVSSPETVAVSKVSSPETVAVSTDKSPVVVIAFA